MELFVVHFLIGAEGAQVALDELLLELFREAGAGLPDEGGYVVIDGAAAASLEVYEPGLALLHEHVPGLEIPVHKGVALVFQEVLLQFFEVFLQQDFVEFQTGGLEETVFEIVKVKVHHAAVEGLVHTAVPVQALGALELEAGQLFDGAAQAFGFDGTVDAAFPAFRYQVEEDFVAQVFLHVAQFVRTHGQDGRHTQALVPEVLGKVDKGPVLFQVVAQHADEGEVAALEAEVAPVAARRG